MGKEIEVDEVICGVALRAILEMIPESQRVAGMFDPDTGLGQEAREKYMALIYPIIMETAAMLTAPEPFNIMIAVKFAENLIGRECPAEEDLN